MLVLGMDTAFAAVSVALVRDGRRLAGRTEAMDRGQSEALMPMIGRVMADAGAAFADLDRIAVTRGPGAFTGIRIALSAARALALGSGCGAFGVSTFEAVAAAVPEAERQGRRLLVVFDTKRGDFYAQVFDASGAAQGAALGAALGDGRVVGKDALVALVGGEAVTVVGDGAEAAAHLLAAAGGDARVSAASALPDAARVATLGAALPETASPPEPLYLRPPAVTLPGVGRVG